MTSSTDRQPGRDPFVASPSNSAANNAPYRRPSSGMPPKLAYFLIRVAAGIVAGLLFAWAQSM